MLLPGGIARSDGSLSRGYAWGPLTGHVEEALCEARDTAKTTPELVSAILAAALAELGDREAILDDVDRLSVIDRRALMIRLAARFGLEFQWTTSDCAACGEPFDFPLDLSDLPLVPGGSGYPEAEAYTSFGRVRLRFPNGGDQIAVAREADAGRAIRLLAARCAFATTEPNLADRLSEPDLAAIGSALEAVSPGLPWAVEAPCPECGHANVVPIDVTGWLFRLGGTVIEDVHEIATAYGWTETEILALSRERRQRYLALIRRDRNEWNDEP